MADKNNFNCNFKENVGKVVVILAKKIAAMEVNSSCPLCLSAGDTRKREKTEKILKYE